MGSVLRELGPQVDTLLHKLKTSISGELPFQLEGGGRLILKISLYFTVRDAIHALKIFSTH